MKILIQMVKRRSELCLFDNTLADTRNKSDAKVMCAYVDNTSMIRIVHKYRHVNLKSHMI